MISTDLIFEGATFSSPVDYFTIETVEDGYVYGRGDKFDHSESSKEQMAKCLTNWGYTFIGVE